MAPRKRKLPEKKPRHKKPGLVSRAVAAAGREVARHPRIAGGTAAFCVIFGFVAANALWYQPGGHPSPILRTREPGNPAAIAGYRPAAERLADDAEVTTFRIERAEETGEETAGAAAAPSGEPSTALVMEVQKELSRYGLYDAATDGVSGPRTAAAIMVFQKTVGMEATGIASPELLAALKAGTASVASIPADRPAGDLNSSEAEIDPVAAAIRDAERAAVPASKPQAAAQGTAQTGTQANTSAISSDLVMKIQRGLSNIAYSDVAVDGVAGSQTRAAIRHFEKHYRLPETGVPNEAVLKKLQAIGAL